MATRIFLGSEARRYTLTERAGWHGYEIWERSRAAGGAARSLPSLGAARLDQRGWEDHRHQRRCVFAESENTAGFCTSCALCSAGSNTALHNVPASLMLTRQTRRCTGERSLSILGDPAR